LPAPLLAGWRVVVGDGTGLAGTQHRLKPLRGTRSAALPGKALALYDPQYDLIEAVVPCEDAYTQERALCPQLLPHLGKGDCGIFDRNFCTRAILFGIHRREAAFIVRHHKNLPWEPTGPRRDAGPDRRGRP